MIGLVLFVTAMFMLMLGFPVAFTFAGVALFFGIYAYGFSSGVGSFLDQLVEGLGFFNLVPFRIFSIMQNTTLMGIPMFIFMGIMLQKTGLAEQLLQSMGQLFGGIRGGLAVSTLFLGGLLAASTGVVGSSVVAMGVISLPVMLKCAYDKKFSTGVICAAGTLGQIIPPSIVLIILGDVLQVPVGDLFKVALAPGIVLVVCYIVYALVISRLREDLAPIIPASTSGREQVYEALRSIVPPLLLIVVVLGSIFIGVATPTESSSIGVVGSILLAMFYRRFSLKVLQETALETTKVTAMVFTILIGATMFSMVFSYTGGDELIERFMTSLPGGKWGFIILVTISIFILGFFIDFVEISFIVIPILYPIAEALDINMIWFGVVVAMNLQTSFLTPPFGFALFYLKGVAPPSVSTYDIYKGVIPFILIQLLVLTSIIVFPQFYGLASGS